MASGSPRNDMADDLLMRPFASKLKPVTLRKIVVAIRKEIHHNIIIAFLLYCGDHPSPFRKRANPKEWAPQVRQAHPRTLLCAEKCYALRRHLCESVNFVCVRIGVENLRHSDWDEGVVICNRDCIFTTI